MRNNPKIVECQYCGSRMELRWRHTPDNSLYVAGVKEISPLDVIKYIDDRFHYFCCHCGVNSPYRDTPEEAYAAAIKRAKPAKPKGKWIVIKRHEHYPSGRPYEDLFCSVCGRKDHNGDGKFCGYCGAEMEVSDDR